MKKLFYLVLAFAFVFCNIKAANPVLSIEGGQVQGVNAEIKGVSVFRGIPYAAPPIKNLRWKAPQPVIPWQGIKLADKFGHPGYQAVHYPGGYTIELVKNFLLRCGYMAAVTAKDGVPNLNLTDKSGETKT